VIFEHKSTADSDTAWQLFKYTFAILSEHVRRTGNPRKLPAVISLVLHHSRDGWHLGTRLVDHYDLSPRSRAGIEPLLIDFRFLVDDLSTRSSEDLRRRVASVAAHVALLGLQRVRECDDQVTLLRDLGRLLESARAEPGSGQLLLAVFIYMTRIWKLDAEQFRDLSSRALGEKTGSAMADLVEQFREEHHAKGRAEGRAEGRVELLIEQLEARYGALSSEARQLVRSANDDRLRAWARAIWDVDSVEELLELD
jgi:hypothetical protein